MAQSFSCQIVFCTMHPTSEVVGRFPGKMYKARSLTGCCRRVEVACRRVLTWSESCTVWVLMGMATAAWGVVLYGPLWAPVGYAAIFTRAAVLLSGGHFHPENNLETT